MGDHSRQAADFHRYWGKARAESAFGPRYHLLPYHSLDVAAVMQGLCATEWARPVSRLLGDTALLWLPYIAALHDLGKFARGFQNLASAGHPALVPFNGRYRYGDGVRHDTLGWLAWLSLRDKLSGVLSRPDSTAWDAAIASAVGHHGQPPIDRQGSLGLRADLYFATEDLSAAISFALEAAELLLPQQPAARPAAAPADRATASWLAAGLHVLSDWLGSNQTHFRYVDEPMPLQRYWHEHALPGAHQALAAAGLHAATPRRYSRPTDLLPHLTDPTPLQSLAAKIELSAGPQLFVLEDVTGAGKTEAALILVQRLMSAGAGRGLYFGLPTMATANQMFRRVGAVHRRLFMEDTRPNLVLAHASRHLVDDFRVLPAAPDDRDYASEEASASGACSAWLADSSKKALLADVGVGTLDQALLAVLRVKHQSLRMLGLAGKVLVLDEVHAFQATYTGEVLCALLTAHARFGGSAVLLSATLPAMQRQALVNAFRKGLGLQEIELPLDEARYPLLTHQACEPGPPATVEVPSRPSVSRRVGLHFLHDESAALALVRQQALAGRSVVWIRNTVDDAREAWQRLRAMDGLAPERVTLFHSRFALADRLRIEDRVLDMLGSTSTADMRCGQVVIATAVLEVGLDVDADVMVSDLAPVDALIQRAGRLHRHVRDGNGALASVNGRPAPVLHVLAPVWTEEPTAGWYAACLRRAAHVYPDTARLWLTQRVLRETGGISMPEGARQLVEGVYGEQAEAMVPEALKPSLFNALGKAHAERSQAGFNGLQLDSGYTQQSGRWTDEDKVPTRLAEDTHSVVLLRQTAGGVEAWAGSHPHPWEASTVKLAERVFKSAAPHWHAGQAEALEALSAGMPALKYAVLLVLKTGSTGPDADWQAVGLDKAGKQVEIRYDAVAGWRTASADGEAPANWGTGEAPPLPCRQSTVQPESSGMRPP